MHLLFIVVITLIVQHNQSINQSTNGLDEGMIDKSCAILNEISIKASLKCVAQYESCSLSSIIVSISINFSFQYQLPIPRPRPREEDSRMMMKIKKRLV